MKFKFDLGQYISGIIVPALILLVGLAGYFVLLPKYKSVAVAGGNLQSKQTELDTRSSSLENIGRLIADMKNKQDDLEPADAALPIAPRIPELLGNLDTLAAQSGLKIATLKIVPAATLRTIDTGSSVAAVKQTEKLLASSENLGILEIDMSLKGRFPNIKTFLGNLEDNLRIMDVQSIVTDKVDEGSGAQTYGLKIQTYYQKDE